MSKWVHLVTWLAGLNSKLDSNLIKVRNFLNSNIVIVAKLFSLNNVYYLCK